MKLCIFGSRTIFPSPLEIDQALADATASSKFSARPTCIVSGMAPGTDTCAISWARKKGLPVEQMPAKWKDHGRGAGFIRNGQMAEIADYFIGFWDGESRGTAQMMRCVAVLKKPLHMVVKRKHNIVHLPETTLPFDTNFE